MLIASRGPKLGRLAAALLLAFTLTACASNPDDDLDDFNDLFGYEEPSDPLEPANRAIFGFNEALDHLLLRPVAETYRLVLPAPLRDVVRNFVRHVSSPVTLANDVLQGDWERAENTLARMVANSAVLGLGDLVEDKHPYHSSDFGQTLGVYGVGHGPYLVLPVLGPSSARDGVGRLTDVFFNPLIYVDGTTAFNIGTTAAEGVDTRERYIETLDDLREDAVDFYARMRSLYFQQRRAEVEERIMSATPNGREDLDAIADQPLDQSE